MSTIKDIARISGYCTSTVSYALKGDPKIPLETQMKIKKIASDLNYVPNASAIALKTRVNHSIGVFVPGFKGQIHPTILSGIASVIKQVRNKYKLLITFADDEFLLVYEKQIDAAILMGSHVAKERVIDISRYVPLILVDNDTIGENIYNTSIDNYGGIYARTVDFYKRGVKKFLYVSGSNKSAHSIERLKGFETAIKDCGLKIEDQVILCPNAFDEERGYKIMKEYLSENTLEADGLICANDDLAVGAMKALIENNIKIPNQIKVSGFDNIEKGQYLTPTLSTVSIDWFEYGVKLGNLVLDILDKTDHEKEIVMHAELVDRESGI